MIHDIAVEEILAACGNAETVTLRPGEILFREGDDAHAMYVVRQGTLRILSGSTILETVREGAPVEGIYEVALPDGTRERGRFKADWLPGHGRGGTDTHTRI